MRCNQKVQAAMEYLMTYGWAILVIAFVLGAIFQLGLFGTSTSSLGSSCLASTGFLCQNPTLNTSGYLAVKFGQIISNPITVTALGCSNNNTLPTSTTSVNLQVASGQSVGLSFPCTLAANSIGSAFKGYLWLTYSTASQSGIVDKMAVVTTKVSTTGNSLAVASPGSASAGSYIAPFIATCGGALTSSNGNYICTFTSSGTFTVTSGNGNVAALVVAGGGAGSISVGYSGGGGAGGVIYTASFAVSTRAYNVVVGSGGVASGNLNGANSIFGSMIAIGGGTGACSCGSGYFPQVGGSGGGGSTYYTGGASGTSGQGNSGGNSDTGAGAGGGGAGGAGINNIGSVGGAGGAGITSSISGNLLYYGGGGGGGGVSGGGSGGSGGGGGGYNAISQIGGLPAAANSGGGGGGGSGSGGSGIVIIAYNSQGNGTP